MTIPAKNDYQFAAAQLIDTPPQEPDIVYAKATTQATDAAHASYDTAIVPVESAAVTDVYNAPVVTGAPVYGNAPVVVTGAPVSYGHTASHAPTVTAVPVGHAGVLAFKRRRLRQQKAAMIVGGIGGLVLLGPIGAIIGGLVAHTTTKAVGRGKQARMQRRLNQQQQLNQPPR
jgi:hypothetical protein